VLSTSRIFFMLLTLFIMSTAFYLVMFAGFGYSETFKQYVSNQEFLKFILIWIGYSMAVGGFNTYIEFGTNGKVLFIFSPIIMILLFVTIFLFYQLTGMGIVEWTLILAKGYGWLAVGISLLCGVLGCFLAYKLLKHRLLRRDYL